jgi:hypothetical protein
LSDKPWPSSGFEFVDRQGFIMGAQIEDLSSKIWLPAGRGRRIFILSFWAHFLLPQKTGLSACIFFAGGKKGLARKRKNCNPLRGPNGTALRPGEFALRANSWASLGGVWGFAPSSENQNEQRFGSPFSRR